MTLGFLIAEMRANTNAIHDQTYQYLTEQLNGYRTNIVDSGWLEAREKLLAGGWENLTRVEQDTLRLLRLNLYGIYESAYYAEQRGVIGANEWGRLQFAICTNFKRDVERGLWYIKNVTPIPNLLTPEFAAHIVESCK